MPMKMTICMNWMIWTAIRINPFNMRRLLVVLVFLTLSLSTVKPVRAQAVAEVTDAQVAYRFGEQINFQARVTASVPINDVAILFRAEGESSTRSAPASLGADGEVTYQYLFQQGPLRPFAPVDFWFRVSLQNGDKLESAPSRFYYIDNRFPWKTVEDGNIRLHWYIGDDAFAQQARDIARTGLQKTGEMLSVTPSHVLDVYIYALAADLQSTLQIGGKTPGVGGEASPDLGVALVAIAPGLEQGPEMERKIPHELAHLLTYELVGPRYDRLPLWLREGIASMAEPANLDYANAIKQQPLIPIADLCDGFPPEMSRIFLAYAESESFTRFIVNKYGDSGLIHLSQAYADGLDCQQGPVRALGNPLDQVEQDWLSGNTTPRIVNTPSVLDGLLPYLALLGMMAMVPVGFLLTIWRMPYGGKRPGSE
jgi:hypothetical protein